MIRRPPVCTRTDTLFPDTTLFRSGKWAEQQWSRVLKVCLASGFDYSRFLCATVFERIDSFDKKLSSRCREIAGLCQANVGGGAQAHLPPLSVTVPDVDPALRSVSRDQ